MTTIRSRLLLALASLGATAMLTACAHKSADVAQTVSAAPDTASFDRVIALLDQGDEAGARRQLTQIQKRSPGDITARVLAESIDKDPVELLGPKSFSYTTQPGDTMIDLAARFLGNRIKFYQLARYNGVRIPAMLAAGTMLRIPGTPPSKPATSGRPAPRPSEPAAARPTRARPVPAPAAAAPAAPAANPVLAGQLRGAGLAALNQGKIDRAVALLRRAAALDPRNPLIARELSRAQRIANTVRTRQ